MVRAFLLAVISAAATAKAAPTFRWTDAQGNVHYSDSRDRIPPGVRVDETEGDEVSVIAGPKLERREARPKTAEEADREQSWKAKFREVRKRLQKLTDDVAHDEKRLAEIEQGLHMGPTITCPGSAMTAQGFVSSGCYALPNSRYERLKSRLERKRVDLKHAQDDLADLERLAALDAVPFEWRK